VLQHSGRNRTLASAPCVLIRHAYRPCNTAVARLASPSLRSSFPLSLSTAMKRDLEKSGPRVRHELSTTSVFLLGLEGEVLLASARPAGESNPPGEIQVEGASYPAHSRLGLGEIQALDGMASPGPPPHGAMASVQPCEGKAPCSERPPGASLPGRPRLEGNAFCDAAAGQTPAEPKPGPAPERPPTGPSVRPVVLTPGLGARPPTPAMPPAASRPSGPEANPASAAPKPAPAGLPAAAASAHVRPPLEKSSGPAAKPAPRPSSEVAEKSRPHFSCCDCAR